MAHQSNWDRLIRFKDADGQVRYGEPNASLDKATVWEGGNILELRKTDQSAEVKEILAPYAPDTILCIGLNYREHAKEAGFKIPDYPVLFHKNKTCITGPYSDVAIPKRAGNIDYENELCVIVARDAKDVSEEQALDYVLAYTVGNDVSSREWQMPDKSGGVPCFAKGFDGFCPIGPQLISSRLVDDPNNLKMTTKRNGEVVQNSNTSDMIFGVKQLISFLSQDTTISAGTLILTGTPPGVAMFASKPPNFLKKGEVVECEIEKIGSLRNKFV